MSKRTLYWLAAGALLLTLVWRLTQWEASGRRSYRDGGGAHTGPSGVAAPAHSSLGSSAPNARSEGDREADTRRSMPPDVADPAQLVDQALYAESPAERSVAASRLSRLSVPRSEIQRVVDLVRNPAEEESVRVRAVELLKLAGDRSLVPVLEEASLRDPSERVRQAAAEALGWIGN